ncbi:MAG: glycosyltransferase family 4 protein [Candidatus Altiarchaeota archaeon]|nr:glycosyltransferase family 4 protein [Candidatus Altiarchaeota archaeon]
MRVAFKQIKVGSGTDTWAKSMVKGLEEIGVESFVDFYPYWCQMFPYILNFLDKRSNCDIIQSNSWYGFAFKREGIPLVIVEHLVVHIPELYKYKTITQKIGHRLFHHYEKKSLDVADVVVCVSEDTRKQLEKVFGYRDSTVIYNGVDINMFKPQRVGKEHLGISNDKTVLLFVGNMIKRKGADLLPRIMHKLGDDFILLCTSGLRKNFIKSEGNIKVIGSLTQQQLVEYYNLCDIFLFPSRLESFGLSVAEAMSCGKPIVCTNCSALPELVINGRGGFLCEMDNVDDFVEKIRIIAEDENLREKMGRFNRRRVEDKFTLSRMSREYYELYRRL